MGGVKVYRAHVRLGVTTDTFDSDGLVVSERAVTVTFPEFRSALDDMEGEILQRPPVFSAVKRHGVPLHRLVRQGINISRDSLKPRKVTILGVDVRDWNPPECTIEVTCSSGTYIRALVHDVGQSVGCGAHVTGLVRLASGDFDVSEAVQLHDFQSRVAKGDWMNLLHPIDDAVQHLPAIHVAWPSAKRLCVGQTIREWEESAAQEHANDLLARAYAPDQRFLAIVAYDPGRGVWKPHKVFCSAESLPCR